jgi:hypothetical protein
MRRGRSAVGASRGASRTSAGAHLDRLAEEVALVTGGTVEIIENGGTAWSIDPGGELPGSARPLVVVRVHVDDPKSIDPVRLDGLVAAAKPAHVEHRVEIVRAGKASRHGEPRLPRLTGEKVPPRRRPRRKGMRHGPEGGRSPKGTA